MRHACVDIAREGASVSALHNAEPGGNVRTCASEVFCVELVHRRARHADAHSLADMRTEVVQL